VALADASAGQGPGTGMTGNGRLQTPEIHCAIFAKLFEQVAVPEDS
jgi:hypothetical protein